MSVSETVKDIISKAYTKLFEEDPVSVRVEHPLNTSWGDYSTNVAMISAKRLGISPVLMAEKLKSEILKDSRS